MRKREKDRTDLSIDDFYSIKSWYNILPDLPEPLPPPKEPGDGISRIKFMQSHGENMLYSRIFIEE